MKNQQQTNKQTKKELDYDSLTGSAHYFTGRDIHFAGLCLPITSTPYFSFPACIDWSGAASPSRLSAHAHNQPPRHSHFIFTARQDKLPCQKKKKGGGRGGEGIQEMETLPNQCTFLDWFQLLFPVVNTLGETICDYSLNRQSAAIRQLFNCMCSEKPVWKLLQLHCITIVDNL